MTQPAYMPGRRPERPIRPPRPLWVAGLVLIAFVLLALLGGYQVGKRYTAVDIWDPLWLRAYINRPQDTSDPNPGFWVAGYYVDYDRGSLNVVKTKASHMDQVVIFGYGFDQQGHVTGQDQDLIKGITGPQKRVLLFGNLTNGGFHADTAHAILTDSQVQARAIEGILGKTEQLSVSGVQIDFENIPPGDRAAYTAFLKTLKGVLQPKGMTLSIAAAAKTSDTKSGWGGATDYVAVGQIVDYFYIMAYDEHWRGGPPGPVASLGWVEKVVRYATGVMPAQKVILGVPFYGYEWSAEPNGGTKTNKAIGAANMEKHLAELGAKVTWDPVVGENVATFKTGDGERIAWYPDQRSLDAKLRLAYQYNLKGLALWRAGFEPDNWWERMGSFRLNPAK